MPSGENYLLNLKVPSFMTVRVVMSTHMLGLLPEIVYLCNSLWFIGVLQITVMCYSISGMNSELE